MNISETDWFHYIIFPTLEIRRAPDSKSEVVSQGLFSENISILEEWGRWLKIKTLVDNYVGWAKKEGVCSRTSAFITEESASLVTTCRLAAHLYEHADTIYGPMLTLPFESRLVVIEDQPHASRWLKVVLPDFRMAYIQRGDLSTNSSPMSCQEVCLLSYSFLGLPYTWGGRSSFGYDCSGFVQMLYRQMDIFLPRDAKDQFTFSGFIESPIETLMPGDLIFFGFSKEHIKHVGFALGAGKFIHTAAAIENMPYLRISHLSDFAWNGSGYYPFLAGRKQSQLVRPM